MKSISQTASTLSAFILLVLLLAPASNAAITCGSVISNLSSCLTYLRSNGGTPSSACCSGAKALAASATTAADKQTACSCMKNAASRYNVNQQSANALPKSCGITLPFNISPSVDCSKIS